MKVSKHSSRKYTRSWVAHASRAANIIGTAYRGYKSRTRTQTKSHVERLKGDDIHSGVTDVSYTVVVSKSKKSADFRAMKNQYQELTGGRFVGEAGQQVVNLLTTVGTVKEWMISNGTGTNNFGTSRIGAALFAQNPAQYSTGSDKFGSLIGTRLANDKFYLSRCNVKVSVCNFANMPATVWMYVLVSKIDHNQDPHIDWSETENIDGLQQPQADNPSAGNQTGGVCGGNYKELPDNTPGTNQNFRRIWSIKKVHRVNLAAAAQEDVDFHVIMNQIGDVAKFISLNYAMSASTGTWTNGNITQLYPRGSVAIMVVHRGGVVHDVTAEGGTADAVTFGKTNVGYVVSKQYVMYPMKAKTNRFETKLAYPQIPYGTNSTNQKIMDIVDAVTGFETA